MQDTKCATTLEALKVKMATSVRIKKFPADYAEHVYAGLLGLSLGIAAGRKQSGADRLTPAHELGRQLGRIGYDLNLRGDGLDCAPDERLGTALLAARILEDFGGVANLGPEHAAWTFQNHALENCSGLWWGGMGRSAPHSAMLRLKRGVPAGASGSSALNGVVVSEQAGAELFGPAFGLAFPGDPMRAADLAGKCARVFYDGEALCAAQASAAFVSAAFSAANPSALFDAALRALPLNSAMAAMLANVHAWSSAENSWQHTRELIHENYFGVFPDGHAVPQFAGVALALAHGGGSMRSALEIAALAGWGDATTLGLTACVLCALHGLLELESLPFWTGALNDRLVLPGADGARCSTDAASEALALVRVAKRLQNINSAQPKNGARLHFELPRSTHGFAVEISADSPGLAVLQNVTGHSALGSRSLAIQCNALSCDLTARIAVPVFAHDSRAPVQNCPALYPGQTIRAFVSADPQNTGEIGVRPFIRFLGHDDQPCLLRGPEKLLMPEARHEFKWTLPSGQDVERPADTIRLGRSDAIIERVPSLLGSPIVEAGLEIFKSPASKSTQHAASGLLHLDYFTWDGPPNTDLGPPKHNGRAWRNAWVNAATRCDFGHAAQTFSVSQDEGTGLLLQGARDWIDYSASASVTPRLARAAGIAVRVQGLQRYYALLLFPGNIIRLIRQFHGAAVLAEKQCAWHFGQTVDLQLRVEGQRLSASANNDPLFTVDDPKPGLECGAVALLIDEGCLESGPIRIE